MQSKLSPLLPQLEDLWSERGWPLSSLHGQFRMEGDGGGGSGGGSGSGEGGDGGGSGEGGGSGGSSGSGGDGGSGNEPPFPANTPVAEMTDKQAAAYWKHQSRKHESRASERADYDEIKKRAEQYDTLSSASKTENERAVETARQEADDAARKDERQKTAVLLVDAKLEAVAAARGVKPEQLTPLLDALDRTKFLTDAGEVDADKVTNFVASIAPAEEPGNGNKGARVPNLGQGRRGGDQGGTPKSVSAGADRYAERHKKAPSAS